MGNTFPTTGVKLVADNSSAFVRDINNATNVTKKFETTLGSMSKSSSATTSAMKQISTWSIAAGVALGQALYDGATKAVTAMTSLGKETISAAMRFQELTMVAALLGQQQGYSTSQIEEFISGVRQAGIEADVAAKAVTQFSRYNIDMAKAVDLARVAQDAAIISGSNSSDTLDRLIYGIVTQQTEVLRTAGINVQFADSYKKMADELGVTTEQLTSSERVQAALNAVMEEGVKISGAYAVAMETPGKQLRSFPRYINDIMVSLGSPFLGTLSNVVSTATNAVKAFGSLVAEGGALEPVLLRIGTVAELVSDGFKNMADVGIKQIVSFIEGGAMKFTDFATKAFEWGFNISAELGLGMAEGATQVISYAISLITNMLSFWLSPGSPPRVAPDIDKWGMDAMAEYLKGFTEADFSGLTGIQSSLQSALSALAGAGFISKDKTGDIFASISESLIRGFDAGNISKAVQQIRSQLGPLGNDVATLAIKEFKLAQATEAVEKAEEALAKANEKHETAVENMDQAMEEYNDLVLKGASKEAIEAKRAEFYAARDQVAASNDEIDVAEKQVSKAKKRQSSLEKEVRLQQQLVQQLIELAQARAEEAKAAAGGTGTSLGRVDLGNFAEQVREKTGSLKLSIEEKMEQLKQSLARKIRGMFAPFQQQWEDLRKQWEEEIVPKWETLLTTLDTYWHTYMDPLEASIKEFSETTGIDLGDVGKAIGEIATAILLLSLNIPALTVLFPGVTSGLTHLIGFATWTARAFKEIKKQIEESGGTMNWLKDKVLPILGQKFLELIKPIFDADMFMDGLNTVSGFLSDSIVWLKDKIKELIVKVIELSINIGTGLSGKLKDAKEKFEALKTKAKEVADTLKDKVTGAVDDVKEAIGNLINSIAGDEGLINTMVQLGKDLIGGLIAGIQDSNTVKALEKAIAGLANMVPDWIMDLWGERSPSKVAAEKLGMPFTEGIGVGLIEGIPELEKTVATLAGVSTMRTGYAADAIAAGNSLQRTYNTQSYNTNQYNLTLQTAQSQQTVVQSFQMMKLLGNA